MVCVVVIAENRDELRALLLHIEASSQKGSNKWSKASFQQKQAYIRQIIQRRDFYGRLFYKQFTQTLRYRECIIETIAEALTIAMGSELYRAIVQVDAQGKKERYLIKGGLRRWGIVVEDVRGPKDDHDEFIRLADAVAGFVRDGLEAHPKFQQDWEVAKRRGPLREV